MPKQILVPLDGSPQAESALPVAARLARAAQGSLVLVRAIRGLAEVEMGLLSADGWAPAADPQERDEASAYLQRIAHGEALSGISVQTIVATGPAGAAILKAARTRHADLIVMTSREREGLARWLLGSVARQVLREAEVPVLVLRAGREGAVSTLVSSPEQARSWRVLVALDGSKLAEAAIGPAVELATVLSAPNQPSIDLVRVVELVPTLAATPAALGAPVGYGLTDDLYTEAMREARAYLTDVGNEVRQREADERHVPLAEITPVTETAVLAADVAGTIAAIAQGRKATADTPALPPSDFIAVATHGRSGLTRLILGSVTERLLDSTALPVLVVPPPVEATGR